jgi:holo-ACP synthase/triphosphoribosyl-dephospho-CoA synthase
MDECLEAVLPQEILDSKERRVMRQKKMLTLGNCVISFTLNIAGAIKISPLILKCFNEGLKQIECELKYRRITVQHQEQWIDKTGCEAMFSVKYDALKIKKFMVIIEESSKLGRLFDIDVLSEEGYPITRSELGLNSRQCLVCGFPAHQCVRGRRHDIEIIMKESKRIMRDYFLEKQADYVASTACRSLLYEVCVTPKPGLVDRNNSGAHKDMDIFTFMDSVSVLTPYFKKLFLMGNELKDTEPAQLLFRLRHIGILAEDDMLAITNQVNTHKGLIFSLGILCAALGWSEANQRDTDAASLLSLCGEIASASIEEDLISKTSKTAMTGGERLFLKTGNAGARGEAAAGFPVVLNYALPTLRRLIAEGKSMNDAGVYTLLVLISKVTDTNIITRCGLSVHQRVQQSIQELISDFPNLDIVKEYDLRFIEQNISPGGCADLLVITFMLYFLETNNHCIGR